jgi:hypothetical protein
MYVIRHYYIAIYPNPSFRNQKLILSRIIFLCTFFSSKGCQFKQVAVKNSSPGYIDQKYKKIAFSGMVITPTAGKDFKERGSGDNTSAGGVFKQ